MLISKTLTYYNPDCFGGRFNWALFQCGGFAEKATCITSPLCGIINPSFDIFIGAILVPTDVFFHQTFICKLQLKYKKNSNAKKIN